LHLGIFDQPGEKLVYSNLPRDEEADPMNFERKKIGESAAPHR
jgi:hypothetical protein